ncbi:membrane protein with a O-antigen polymerase related domain [Clostridium perfringens]|nr:membrane protein with a O-antigen polymerase related domain [Clostridium perfringens]
MLYLNKLLNAYILIILTTINFFIVKNLYFTYSIIILLIIFLIINKNLESIVESIFISIFMLYLNNINIINIIFILIIFKLLIIIIINRIKFNKSLIIYSIFIFFNVFNFLFLDDKKFATEGIIMYLMSFILSFYVIQCKKSLINFYNIIKFIAFFNFLFIFIFYINNYRLLGNVYRWDIYFNGYSGLRSNGIGTFIISMIPFNLYFVINNKFNIVKIFNFILILLSIITIFILSSRSAIITVIIVLLMLYLKCNFKYKFKIPIFFIVILAILIGIDNIFNINLIANTLKRFITEGSINDFTSGRIELYKYAIDAFKNNPILGVGVYNLGYFVYKYSIFLDCHNFILNYLATTGILGTILFISWLYVTVVSPFIKIKLKDFSNITIPFLFAAIINIIQSLFEPVITVSITFIIFSLYANMCMEVYNMEGKG